MRRKEEAGERARLEEERKIREQHFVVEPKGDAGVHGGTSQTDGCNS